MPQKVTPDASRRSETARRAILAAALDLVGEVGYAKLTIEGIAAAAGVGKQTIYRWWPSKGSLLFDAFLTLATDGQEDQAAALPDTGDVMADLKMVLRATVAELNEPRYDQPMRALHTEIVHDPALAADYALSLIHIKRQEPPSGPGNWLRTLTSTWPSTCCSGRSSTGGSSAPAR